MSQSGLKILAGFLGLAQRHDVVMARVRVQDRHLRVDVGTRPEDSSFQGPAALLAAACALASPKRCGSAAIAHRLIRLPARSLRPAGRSHPLLSQPALPRRHQRRETRHQVRRLAGGRPAVRVGALLTRKLPSPATRRNRGFRVGRSAPFPPAKHRCVSRARQRWPQSTLEARGDAARGKPILREAARQTFLLSFTNKRGPDECAERMPSDSRPTGLSRSVCRGLTHAEPMSSYRHSSAVAWFCSATRTSRYGVGQIQAKKCGSPSKAGTSRSGQINRGDGQRRWGLILPAGHTT